MAKSYKITIVNGEGTAEVLKDNYTVTVASTGYDESTILPSTVDITSEEDSYSFTVGATGTLTLHVSDSGTPDGTAIVGATFVRCDSEGNTYGSPIESDNNGNAVFNNVPYASTEAPIIYYKQTASDGEHDFDTTLQQISLEEETLTKEVLNSAAALKTFTITDANYNGLPIVSAEIGLN